MLYIRHSNQFVAIMHEMIFLYCHEIDNYLLLFAHMIISSVSTLEVIPEFVVLPQLNAVLVGAARGAALGVGPPVVVGEGGGVCPGPGPLRDRVRAADPPVLGAGQVEGHHVVNN